LGAYMAPLMDPYGALSAHVMFYLWRGRVSIYACTDAYMPAYRCMCTYAHVQRMLHRVHSVPVTCITSSHIGTHNPIMGICPYVISVHDWASIQMQTVRSGPPIRVPNSVIITYIVIVAHADIRTYDPFWTPLRAPPEQ